MWLLCSIFATQIQGCRINAWWNILGIWPFCFSGFGWIWNWRYWVTCETSYWFALPASLSSQELPEADVRIQKKEKLSCVWPWRRSRALSERILLWFLSPSFWLPADYTGDLLLPCTQSPNCDLLEIHSSASLAVWTCILQSLIWLEECCKLLQ